VALGAPPTCKRHASPVNPRNLGVAPRNAVGDAYRVEAGVGLTPYAGGAVRIAATRSFDPAPQREIDRIASLNAMSTMCTRALSRMYTAPANGVGMEGTNTVTRRASTPR
jgi:hypothetical protein